MKLIILVFALCTYASFVDARIAVAVGVAPIQPVDEEVIEDVVIEVAPISPPIEEVPIQEVPIEEVPAEEVPIDLGCDYIMECAAGQKWDFGICGCAACEPLDCSQIGEYDPDSCQCIQIVCDPAYGCGNWLGFPKCQCTACIDEPCFDGPRSLDNFCQCEEVPVCDPPSPTPVNQIWQGYPDCNFVCDPKLPACANGQPRDNNCECKPMIVCDPMWPPPYPANEWLPYPSCKWVCNPETCPAGQRWSRSQCSCKNLTKYFPVERKVE